MIRRLTVWLVLFALGTGSAFAETATTPPQSAGAAQPQHVCADAAHHAFDFWIGEWNAYVTGTDQLVGVSTIGSEDDGCVITEHWVSQRAAYSGRSLNLYDAASGRWEQFWVDSDGDVTHFVGAARTDGMQLTAIDDVSPDDPTPHFTRITFTRDADGTVRQYGDASPDGVTWTKRYDFTYRRRP